MALIKAIETPTGTSAEYWRIVQYNSNADRGDAVVTLACYKDRAARLAGKHPTEVAAQFIFEPNDHPLSEFDPDLIDTSDVDDVQDLYRHILYQHVKATRDAGAAKTEANRTANEQTAQIFAGSTDVY